MVVAPGAAHSPGLDVIGDRIFAAAKLSATDRATRILFADLLPQQPAHRRRRAVLAVAARVARILDPPHAREGSRRSWLSSAAEARAVDRTQLVFCEFHSGTSMEMV